MRPGGPRSGGGPGAAATPPMPRNSRCETMISVIACLTLVSSPAGNGEIPSSSSRRPGVLSRSAALSFRPAPRRSEPGEGCLDPPQDLRVGRDPVRGARCWGLRGSAVAGAWSGTGAGSLAAFGGHAGLLCGAGLLIAGEACSLRWSVPCWSRRWPALNCSSDQTTLPPHSRGAYQFHRWLSVATRNNPRPPSSAGAGVPSSSRPGRTGGRGSASQTSMSSRSLSLDRRSRTGSGRSCPAVALTALVTSSLFTELPSGFPQLSGHAGGFGVRDFCLPAGYVLLPCSRRLRSPVTS